MADTDPAHDDRLRIANIQGFIILQWCSLPLIGVRLPHFQSLDYKPRPVARGGVSPRHGSLN